MASTQFEEVVIAYSAADIDFVRRLADSLRQAHLNVWYASPSSDMQTLGQIKSQAILGCKVFIPIMSTAAVGDKHLHDELALAYISNSAIFPVGLCKFRDLAPKLSGGTKLMLAKINWVFVFKEEQFDTNIPQLINCIKTEIAQNVELGIKDDDSQPGFLQTHGMNIHVNFTHGLNFGEEIPNQEEISDHQSVSGGRGLSYDFWDRHFEGKSEVTWIEFREAFLQDYAEKITTQYSEDKKKLFVNLIYKDIIDLSKTVSRSVYDQFCAKNPKADPHCFYNRVQDYAIAYISLREVIDMDSTVRITTIQNLGKFTFPAIVSGLTDMLKDDDPNIRAVAAIALAKSGKHRKDTVDKLVGILEDEDRLVRESACLSLGFLKATKAVVSVVDRWRNDPISTVRQAAELALKRMNVEEAQKCIKVTEVLSKEMSALKPAKK